ncbi:MAG: anti-sigma factor antagonist [Clostridia bacterium]|nr:anti-sigma factor antagonist [Clostridia bacterium]
MLQTTDQVRVSKTEDRTTFIITGEVDHHSAKRIKKLIDSEIFIGAPRNVVLDLSSVDFMDSSGLGLILGRYKISTELGIPFYLSEPAPSVMKILKISGCDRMINIIKRKKNT